MSATATRPVILASTSPYRRQLLERLRIPFECRAPGIEEIRAPAEDPKATASRLARLKAEAVVAQWPGAVVIGSDQVAVRGQDVLGKPGNVERCLAQLRESSGREVVFFTAVHVVDGRHGRSESHVDETRVRFRTLEDAEIARYVAADDPLDCAGGFKAESLGIALFERIDAADPTALTGLPLIWLSGALRRAGVVIP